MPEPRLAIFRALKLGDMLCAVPAFRALRHAWPQAHIALIGLPSARSIVERMPNYIDELITFSGPPDLPETPAELSAFKTFAEAMQARSFDLALQMHGTGTLTNAIVAQFGARRVAGFCPADEPSPDPLNFLPWVEAEPESTRYLRLLQHLGVPGRGDRLEFPIFESDREHMRHLLDASGLSGEPYVCLHPGASVEERRWSAPGFSAVGSALLSRGLRVVLTGSSEEIALTARVGREMTAAPLDLAGKTDLGALAALLEGARLLVCNDTGVSHLAAAVGTPSVVISPVSDPRRWAPLDRVRHRVVDARQGATVSDVLHELDSAPDLPRIRADAQC